LSFYTALCSTVIFPLHEALKRHGTVGIRRKLERSQWWSVDEIRDLQLQKLKALLLDAQQHVPYYREMFARLQFDPNEVSNLRHLEKLPLLSKTDIRDNLNALVADDAKGLSRFNTGGSSGEPLVFFISRRRVGHDVAAKWRATRWWGVDIGDTEAVVWGSPIELAAQDWIRLARDQLLRSYLIPAFDMAPDKLDSFIEQIQVYRPKMLFGYPSALAHIANYALRKGISLNRQGTKVVFVTSECLYDYQRKAIERAFGCPVANGYGGRDAGFIAHECPHGGMHITAEDLIVEIVDQDGRALPPGALGEITITHLETRDFPFIRYRTGDMGILSYWPCSCGRGLPLMEIVQGRSTDFVVAQDGKVMHGLALIYVVREIERIEEFKIIQESLDKTTVQIVAGPDFQRALAERQITEAFKQRLGQKVTINIEYPEFISKERSGKFRYVISHVPILVAG
jgi:phenylacetate-CoA ligase